MSIIISGLLARAGRNRTDAARPRLGVEALEDRVVPAGASVSGQVLRDLTGNGLAAARAAQTAQSGVTVKVFADTNANGTHDSADLQVGVRVTGADGAYSFSNLAAGRYFVKENVPSNHVRTGPAAVTYYNLVLGEDQAVTGQDFSNFLKPNKSSVTNITYTITTPAGVTKTVTNLRGNTRQGDQVTANFTVAATASPTTVTLVSYDAPGPTFNANDAYLQKPVLVVTGTFDPGATGSLTVQVPNNYYQVDLVLGTEITQFGPAGSNIFFSAQNRLLSADNGGTQAFVDGALSGRVVTDGTVSVSAVAVQVAGVNDLGQQVSLWVVPDANGYYSFGELRSGTYTITVTGNINTVSAFNGAVDGGSFTTIYEGTTFSVTLDNGGVGSNLDFYLTGFNT